MKSAKSKKLVVDGAGEGEEEAVKEFLRGEAEGTTTGA